MNFTPQVMFSKKHQTPPRKKVESFFFLETAFTLIELLIVIAILAILATITLLVINPVQMIKQSRDSNRMAEVNQINKALLIFHAFGGAGMGTTGKVYVSIPSAQANCSDLGLPALGGSYAYVCSNSTNYRKIDGNGWIPVDLTSVQSSSGSLFFALPIDPVNTVANGYYYTYIPGSWALSATMESTKYTDASAAMDGGQKSARYEMGNELALNANLGNDIASTYQIPQSGLVGYWRFENNAFDGTENNNDGTITGATYTSGKVGSAVSFDGNDYIDMGDGDILKITGDITVMAWINPSIGSNILRNAYVAKIHNSTPWYGYEIAEANANNDNFGCRYGTSASPLEFAGSTIIQEGSWYHVACVITSLGASLYVNGSLDGIGAGRAITDSEQSFKIGNDFSGSLYTNGIIDEVAIYNRALSAAEVLAIYNGQN